MKTVVKGIFETPVFRPVEKKSVFQFLAQLYLPSETEKKYEKKVETGLLLTNIDTRNR